MVKKHNILVYIICLAIGILLVVFSCVKYISEDNSDNYEKVQWNTKLNYTAGDCDSSSYSAWCPHNLQYDKTRQKFVFLQCHRNGHTGTFEEMTLCYLNPKNPLDYEMLNCPSFLGVGALLITEDGTWYIWTNDKRYTSIDAGKNWKEEKLYTDLPTRYGVYEIDDILYLGDDSNEAGVYRVSYDMGLTWEKRNFGVNYVDCEASFCKFRDEIYAFLRTNTTEYACILKKTLNGWKVINDDKILAGNSDCSPVAFDDYIAIAHINRIDCHLYYTVWDGNKEFQTQDLGMIEKSTELQGDFHCPTLSFGNGYAAIAFMMHTYGNEVQGSYLQAQNNWIIGSYERGKTTLNCQIKKANNGNYPDAESNLKNSGLTFKYPETAVVYQNKDVERWICNDNNYGVCLYNMKNPMSNYRTVTLDGYLVPVYHGNLVAYGTNAVRIDSNKISLVYLGQYQPYCVVDYNGSHYMCITSLHGKKKMMLSLQRKNILYESNIVTDCVETDEVFRVCYIAPHTASSTNNILEYADLFSVSINDLVY